MGVIIRNLHRSTGRPDCPICLDDITKFAVSLSEDCATLELENNDAARKRLVKGFRELEYMVKDVKTRLMTDVLVEVKNNVKNRVHPAKGNPNTLAW